MKWTLSTIEDSEDLERSSTSRDSEDVGGLARDVLAVTEGGQKKRKECGSRRRGAKAKEAEESVHTGVPEVERLEWGRVRLRGIRTLKRGY